ncbi:MAG: hypothetical protein RIE08_18230 [Acidimicrobiales bacterium]
MFACFTTKGGSGCTVFSALTALALARTGDGPGVLAVDLGGDLPAALGIADPAGPGLAEWLGAEEDPPPDALARLEVSARPGLSLLPRGAVAITVSSRAALLTRHLLSDPRPVVVDVGNIASADLADAAAALRRAFVAAASRAWLVTRPCYLALRASRGSGAVPDGVVVMSEPGRALGAADVADVIGAPVVLELDVDPAIARAVDAGLLGTRIPHGARRVLERALATT